jgi:hypothetical protein
VSRVRVKLTIREEPYTVDEDELASLKAQGLLDGGPEPVEDEPVAEAAVEPPAAGRKAKAADTTKEG